MIRTASVRKRILAFAAALMMIFAACDIVPTEVKAAEKMVPVYRLYNPVNGEHLYTTDAHERDVIYATQGWGYEGIAWYATKGTGQPVYRLYQPQLGNHLYTTDKNEVRVLTTTQGWTLDFDGQPLFYSDGSVAVYRLFNSGLNGLHHLTTDKHEYDVIPAQGWAQEGAKLSAVKIGEPTTTQYYPMPLPSGGNASAVQPHVHNYTVTEMVDSSCTAEGHKTYACACGDTYSEPIAKKAHTAGNWEVEKAATEDAAGVEIRKCTECGITLDSREIPKLTPHVHSYTVTETVDSTCTTEGHKTYTCACGDTYSEPVAKKAHTAGNWEVEKAATEDAAGVEIRKCTGCGITLDSREIAKLPHTHHYTVERQEPTCTKAGYEKQTCACGDVISTVLPATGHDYETSVVAPTCTEKGYTAEICKNCGDEIHTNETAALGHKEGTPETVAGTLNPFYGYYTPGAEVVKCVRCGMVLESTPVIPANGTPYDAVDSIYTVYCGKDADGNPKYTYVVGHYDDEDATEMLSLINQYRVDNGLNELSVSKTLDKGTTTRATEIAVLYDHMRPSGVKCSNAENIAMSTIGFVDGNLTHGSVEDIFNAWIASEGHRENILIDHYKYSSIKVFYKKEAYAKVGDEYRYDYEPYWVETFRD